MERGEGREGGRKRERGGERERDATHTGAHLHAPTQIYTHLKKESKKIKQHAQNQPFSFKVGCSHAFVFHVST